MVARRRSVFRVAIRPPGSIRPFGRSAGQAATFLHLTSPSRCLTVAGRIGRARRHGSAGTRFARSILPTCVVSAVSRRRRRRGNTHKLSGKRTDRAESSGFRISGERQRARMCLACPPKGRACDYRHSVFERPGPVPRSRTGGEVHAISQVSRTEGSTPRACKGGAASTPFFVFDAAGAPNDRTE